MNRTYDERDMVHVLKMILTENKGNVITDALCFGIEISMLHYLRALPDPAAKPVTEVTETD